MPDLYFRFSSLTISSFNAALAGAAILTGLFAGWRLRSAGYRSSQIADVLLAGLAGAFVGGRALYIALHWDYFAYHAAEVFQRSTGGVSWHGALAGGTISLMLAARWRGIKTVRLFDALAPGLPLLALAAWWSCGAWACGYGREIDTLARYSPALVWEAPDVYGIAAPRYQTQTFGVILSGGVLLVSLVLSAAPLNGVRFWLTAALLSLGMFAIGFVRGDAVPVPAGLRADQWLDALTTAAGVGVSLFTLYQQHDHRSPGA